MKIGGSSPLTLLYSAIALLVLGLDGAFAIPGPFLSPTLLLTSSHCYLSEGLVEDEKGSLVMSGLESRSLDVFCAKNQQLYRELTVKRVIQSPFKKSSFEWVPPNQDVMLIRLQKDFSGKVDFLKVSANEAGFPKKIRIYGYGRNL